MYSEPFDRRLHGRKADTTRTRLTESHSHRTFGHGREASRVRRGRSLAGARHVTSAAAGHDDPLISTATSYQQTDSVDHYADHPRTGPDEARRDRAMDSARRHQSTDVDDDRATAYEQAAAESVPHSGYDDVEYTRPSRHQQQQRSKVASRLTEPYQIRADSQYEHEVAAAESLSQKRRTDDSRQRPTSRHDRRPQPDIYQPDSSAPRCVVFRSVSTSPSKGLNLHL